jgi:ABC-2 type transport system permease protein
VKRPSGFRVFVKTVIARGYPRVVGHTRNWAWVVTEFTLPMIGATAMVFVYEALHAPSRYIGFVIMGGAMVAFWQNVLWSMATQFYWDRGVGNLEIYTASPASLVAILLGMALGALWPTVLRASVVVILGSVLFRVAWAPSGILPAAGIFVLTWASLYGLGMLLASLFLFYGRDVWHLANGMQEPVYLLSGFYFPVHALGAYVGGAASLIPLTLGLDAMRQLLIPGTPAFIALPFEAAVLAALTVGYALLARLALRVMETRARRDGRLIARWL